MAYEAFRAATAAASRSSRLTALTAGARAPDAPEPWTREMRSEANARVASPSGRPWDASSRAKAPGSRALLPERGVETGARAVTSGGGVRGQTRERGRLRPGRVIIGRATGGGRRVGRRVARDGGGRTQTDDVRREVPLREPEEGVELVADPRLERAVVGHRDPRPRRREPSTARWGRGGNADSTGRYRILDGRPDLNRAQTGRSAARRPDMI